MSLLADLKAYPAWQEALFRARSGDVVGLGEAAKTLQEEICERARTMLPGDAIALFREGQVQYRLGRDAIAKIEVGNCLSSINIGGGELMAYLHAEAQRPDELDSVHITLAVGHLYSVRFLATGTPGALRPFITAGQFRLKDLWEKAYGAEPSLLDGDCRVEEWAQSEGQDRRPCGQMSGIVINVVSASSEPRQA